MNHNRGFTAQMVFIQLLLSQARGVAGVAAGVAVAGACSGVSSFMSLTGWRF